MSRDKVCVGERVRVCVCGTDEVRLKGVEIG